ncbi:MAG: ATP-binding cassette domain-containing protein [Verrucomicrobia bacterium]|nr:ATP-binding cassette domain-containing protein [Verrucomicrobiota bacterium]
MLTISEITKAFGGRTLFENVSIQINREDRIGLVGPNGAGKTTLFSLILGAESPDKGSIAIQRNTVLGHLPQESAPAGEETVLELATAINPEFAELRKLMREGAATPQTNGSPQILDDSETHGADHLKAKFEALGGSRLEARAKQILNGLSFRDRDFERPLREMSGGWIMRAHLARLLVQEPDLLMLDEPTNHLDLEALLWFQDYLKRYPGAVLMISHDRSFLNQLVQSVVEIRLGNLVRFRGNYDDYLVQRKAKDEQHQAAFDNQQREITRLMGFVERFRAKNTKASQAQSKLKQIDRMEKIDAPAADEQTIHFRFPQPARSGRRVIRLTNIDHAYGENVVYRGLNFEAERGQRIVLVGPNGAGKSTLLKLLAEILPVQSGTHELGYQVKAGYYSQHRIENLDPDQTVLEEGLSTPQRVTEQSVRTILGSFLFRGDDVFKKVRVLSGGEKSRLALVKLLLDPPNLLLMDEPTTHLDMASIDALVIALSQYEGTLIFISHDVYFIRAIANHAVHVNDGRLTAYPGGYDYYLQKSTADAARRAALEPVPRNGAPNKTPDERPGVKSKDQKRLEAEQRQIRYRQRKGLKDTVDRLESEIAKLEKRQQELTTQLEDPVTYETPGLPVKINREVSEIQDRLEEVTADWEKMGTKLAELVSNDEK